MSVQACADHMVMVADGIVVGSHVRSFERDQTRFDRRHCVPALDRKPGALRNGASFKVWKLPAPVLAEKDKLLRKPGGDR